MPPAELLRMLRQRPFVSFRIHLDDGTVYEVRHPELVLVGTATAHVYFPDPAQPGLVASWEVVALRHVTRLEPMQAAASS
jgi:hypothetical protein